MAEQQRLYVRNFPRYQHYKTRRPLWVKLYREMLNDAALMALPSSARWIACGMLLLASESENGRVVGDEKELCRRLAVPPKELRSATKSLLEVGFLASRPLARR